jgi:iron(III) transport system ATP-binding protein
MDPDMPILEVRDITVRYEGQALPAVAGLSFAVETGEIFALLGPSGSGKTSALRSIGGFERPDSGTIYLDGKMVEGPSTFVAPDKRGVGFVFQEFALFPHMTVIDNVRYGMKGMERKEAVLLARNILDRAQLGEFTDRLPGQLSGGQQQRVALARAMAPRPHVILMDEPFGSLDPDLRDDARRIIRQVLRDNHMTAIMVTHDQQEALWFADRIGVMNEGHIEQIGTPEELYRNPKTRFVAAFIGGANILTGTAQGNHAETAIGSVELDREANGPIAVALRPEHIVLSDENGKLPTGEITNRMFHGHDVTMKVRVGETTITVWDDYRSPFTVGQTVAVAARSKGTVVL